MLEKILKFLDGRKTVIVAVLGAIVVWVSKENWVDFATAEMLMAIIAILGGGASYATKKLNKKQPQ